MVEKETQPVTPIMTVFLNTGVIPSFVADGNPVNDPYSMPILLYCGW